MSDLLKAVESTDYYAVMDYFQSKQAAPQYDFSWKALDDTVMGFTFADQANADFSKPDKDNVNLLDYVVKRNKSDAVMLIAFNEFNGDAIDQTKLYNFIEQCLKHDADKTLQKFYDLNEFAMDDIQGERLLAESFKLGLDANNKSLMDCTMDMGVNLSTIVSDPSGKKIPLAFAMARNVSAIPYIFKDNVDITAKTEDGSNFLHFLGGGVRIKPQHAKIINDVVTTLLAAGVDINEKNYAGKPPIYYSVGGGPDDGRMLTALFIKNGARITETADPSGLTVEGYILEKWGEDAYAEMSAMQIDAIIASSPSSLEDEIENTPTPRRRRGAML